MKLENSERKILNRICLIIVLTLIFTEVPKPIGLNFLAGDLAGKLSTYPILIGCLYMIYLRKRVLFGFEERIFFRYILILFFVTFISLILGALSFPYYSAIFSGPINQIEKFPYVYNKLSDMNIAVSKTDLLVVWLIASKIKNLIFLFAWTYFASFMIYLWYKDDSNDGIQILSKGIFISLIILCLYGLLDVFYLAGNDYATNILTHLNPIVHTIQSDGTWWPPLLWNNQLRSVFSEPSYFGIYMAFAIPLLWMCLFDGQGKRIYLTVGWILNFICMLFMFLTKARTATMLLFGLIILLIFFCILFLPLKKKVLLGIIISCIFAFILNLMLFNYVFVKPQTTVPLISASSYIEDTVGSLSDIDKRSNRSRYSIMLADFRIGLDHPIFGVGIGFRNAYIMDYLPDKEHLSDETRMWIKNQKEKGILKSGFPKLGEYTSRFAETGTLGIILFFVPPFYLIWNLLKIVRHKSRRGDNPTVEIFFLISLIGTLASGIGDSLNITYAYWIMLGLGYTILRKNREEQHESA